MKEIIINQFQGIGDILFCQPIGEYYVKLGYKVTWPVYDNYIWVKEYFPNINYIKKSELNIDYDNKSFDNINDIEYLPLRYSRDLCRIKYNNNKYTDMDSKYPLINLKTSKWKELTWIRNNRERILYNILNPNNENYILINEYFLTTPLQKINIDLNIYNYNKSLKIIKMRPIDGYSLLDWSLLMEKATYIHTVSTSTFYMLEQLNLKCKELHIYPRLPREKNLNPIKMLLSDKWIVHEY